MKMFTQRISSKSSFSDSIYRYLEKIEIIPFFEDTLRPNKVFNLEKISNIMNQNFGSLNFHDLTDYDLSNIYYHTNNILVSYDISNHCFISSSVGDLTSFINDFTNMFTDYSTSLLYDYTYIDYSVHSGDLTSNIIVITKDQSFVISSPMEQNFVIFSENICNDVTGFVTS